MPTTTEKRSTAQQGQNARAGLSVTVKFDPETAALIRRACAIYHRQHRDMSPTQLARDGARRWAVELLARESDPITDVKP